MSVFTANVLERFPQCETKFEMDQLPTCAEIELAIEQINKLPGLDGHSFEQWKVNMLSMLCLISSQIAEMDFLKQIFELMAL